MITPIITHLWVLRGLLKGLVLIFDQDMRDVQIESDSSTAVQMINEGSPPNSPCIMLTMECKALVENTLREGNKVARMNVEQEDKMVSLLIPRDDIMPLLTADMAGVSFESI